MKNILQIFFVLLSVVGFSQTLPIGWQALTFTETDGDCDDLSGGAQEIFISDVNDSQSGSYGAIEIYNPTNATVNLSTYSIRRSGDYGSGNWAWETTLTGNLVPGGIYLIMLGTNGNVCPNLSYNMSLGQSAGINGNDQIQLRKSGITIDDVILPSSPGYTMVRRPDAEAPKAVFNSADWNRSGQNCGTLGNHTVDPTTPPEIKFIARYRDNPGTPPYSYCNTPARVRVYMSEDITGYTYSYNLRGTTTPVNLNSTTGVFSNLQEDTYILTVSVRRTTAPTIEVCTIEATFNITGGTQTSPIILLNP